MTLHKNHPARSHAFLSRLHDGDLEPGERAHFEAHRAHCKECRDAAAEFERALALFRSSRSSPPPADLAMRVLRKVQTHASSRRTPFGDLFSVDLRWAGAFAAALLVLLVAAPIVLQQQKKAVPAEGPITVDLRSRAVSPGDRPAGAITEPETPGVPAARSDAARARAPQAALQRAEAKPSWVNDSVTQEDARREEKLSKNAEISAARPDSIEKAQAPAAAASAAQAAPAAQPAPALADSLRSSVSSLNRQVAAAPAPQPKAAVEPQGGEGARDQVLVSGELSFDRPARLVIQPFDALGSPPPLETQSQSPGLNDLRGRSFVVVVDGQGRVTDAQETVSKKLAGADGRRRDAALGKDKERDNAASASAATAALKTLRFKPSERQRRLLVRVE